MQKFSFEAKELARTDRSAAQAMEWLHSPTLSSSQPADK